jgi:hypothetical protein
VAVSADGREQAGMGVDAGDYDGDGRLDLVKTNFAQDYTSLYRNEGQGLFVDASYRSGLAATLGPYLGWGAGFVDMDNDGDIDVLVVNLDERPTLLRNDTAGDARWITLRLTGTTSNRDAIGARVTVEAGGRRQVAEVRSGGSYLSHNDMRLHFGLGEASVIDRVTIRWPSGLVETATDLAISRFYTIREGEGDSSGAK